jgi:hypothetical protein
VGAPVHRQIRLPIYPPRSPLLYPLMPIAPARARPASPAATPPALRSSEVCAALRVRPSATDCTDYEDGGNDCTGCADADYTLVASGKHCQKNLPWKGRGKTPAECRAEVLADWNCNLDYFEFAGDGNCRCASEDSDSRDCSQSGNHADDTNVKISTEHRQRTVRACRGWQVLQRRKPQLEGVRQQLVGVQGLGASLIRTAYPITSF